MTDVVLRLNRPILEPARRLLPDMGGFDLSPLVAMVALQLVKILLVAPITDIGMGLTLIGGK
jgi:YggT family protein